MARIRKVEIENFRSIKAFTWRPSAGINCLIGPGDSGKSSILDAIDLCLGARRNVQFTDADFHLLDVAMAIRIAVTLGELDDGLKRLDTYGLYLRGFDAASGEIEDEPEKDSETVLTVRLTVTTDLEPSWALVSDRAEALGQTRTLPWNERVRLAPTRIGALANYHLGWGRGSVLNRLTEERANAAAALAKAGRDARAAFGDEVQSQLVETLGIVSATARELGIPVGGNVRAMMDAYAVSFTGGTISLHDEDGIPLSGLGSGSTRLLVAGLQRRAAAKAAVILIDEIEHGLEPHRIMRLLGSLGAKEDPPPLQVFLTTHSPVVLRELSGDCMCVVRPSTDRHKTLAVGTNEDIQSTIRLYPDAFLALSIILCEGASEVGLLLGLDHYRVGRGKTSITARGVALVDCGGGEPDRAFYRAAAFQSLGYRTAVVRDSDTMPSATVEGDFIARGGKVTSWREGRALEDELFASLTNNGVAKLLARAIELHGEDLVNDHIKSASRNATDLTDIRSEELGDGISPQSRVLLGKAARAKRHGWFKSITWMEEAACEIVGPDLENSDPGFRLLLDDTFLWADSAPE